MLVHEFVSISRLESEKIIYNESGRYQVAFDIRKEHYSVKEPDKVILNNIQNVTIQSHADLYKTDRSSLLV